MNTTGKELEVKFLVKNLNKIESRLQDLEAQLVQSRIFEKNLRFDLPDESLQKSFRVLRLRQDENAVLTFKSRGKMVDGLREREEWEVTVSDFALMQKILASLGYDIYFIYEKYRTTYELNSAHVMLDETPLGFFVEIEGENKDSIVSLANLLHLEFSEAITESYLFLFEQAQKSLEFKFRDLTFDNFNEVKVEPSSLGVTIADKGK
jgi:adenylate cyclase, class 2